MNQDFVLRTIGTLMEWDDDTARTEFAWLRLMSRMKYDDYQEFLAGMRFVESLADWLQQFKIAERQHAYDFVRSRLIFCSEPEMRHLAELLYPETVEPLLLARTAELAEVPRYRVWADGKANALYKALLRKTVFMELSDGARLDVFRRCNEGRISNEQVVTAPRINKSKWDDMLKDLRKDLDDPDAKFAFAVLVDDFTASGKTLFRFEDNQWKGKLQKFWDDLKEVDVLRSHFDDDWRLVVHHYLSTSQAVRTIEDSHNQKRAMTEQSQWFNEVTFKYGSILPPEIAVTKSEVPDFSKLVDDYYDKAVESRHTQVGGDGVRWGFGDCALPLVLEHNTPNNTIALLWAETPGGPDTHEMRPLFRRRQRHV